MALGNKFAYSQKFDPGRSFLPPKALSRLGGAVHE
jgi:hypothetical protein